MENMQSICRVCLNEGSIHIFTTLSSQELAINIRLMACSSLSINSNDGFPSNICCICLSELDIAYNFRLKCEVSEAKLRKLLELPIKLENIPPWDNDTCTDNEDEKNKSNKNCLLKREIKHEAAEIDVYVKNKTTKHKTSQNKLTKKVTNSNVKHKKSSKNKHTVRQTLRNIKKHIPREKVKKKGLENVVESSMDMSLEENEPEKSNDRDKTGKHMCTTCGKTFLYLGNLLDHERVHSGDKPYSCQICDRRFSQTGHLLVHQRTHSGVKPYQCEICSRAFSVSHTLKKHLRTHTGERPYSCTMCSKSFVTSYHLSNHFKRHTGEKEFKCDFPDCQHGFVNISEMKRHRARHDKPKDLTKPKVGNLKNMQERYQTMSVTELQNFASKILPNNIKTNNEFRKYLDSIFQHSEGDLQ